MEPPRPPKRRAAPAAPRRAPLPDRSYDDRVLDDEPPPRRRATLVHLVGWIVVIAFFLPLVLFALLAVLS